MSRTPNITPTFPIVIIGTRAQLIKMAPVLLEMESRKMDYRLIFTGQHLVTMQELLDDFDVRTRPVWLGSRREVDTLGKMIPWFIGTLGRLVFAGRRLFAGPRIAAKFVLVHGDTFSTLLGTIAGRAHRCTVVHIESGLRSFKLTDPFPEELTRVLVFRLCHVAFCPGKWATSNMERYRARAINTGQNTLLDAVRLVRKDREEFRPMDGPPYCIVSVHRFENLHSAKRLRAILAMIRDIAAEYRVEFVMHPATKARLQQMDGYQVLQDHPAISLRDRMGYRSFIGLLSGASFVLTDGGSNQEELSYLGIPALIARDRTERHEGLGNNAEFLTPNEYALWRDRLNDIWQRLDVSDDPGNKCHPSKIIVDWLSKGSNGDQHH